MGLETVLLIPVLLILTLSRQLSVPVPGLYRSVVVVKSDIFPVAPVFLVLRMIGTRTAVFVVVPFGELSLLDMQLSIEKVCCLSLSPVEFHCLPLVAGEVGRDFDPSVPQIVSDLRAHYSHLIRPSEEVYDHWSGILSSWVGSSNPISSGYILFPPCRGRGVCIKHIDDVLSGHAVVFPF